MPNCIAYDPAYAYELAVIVHDGLRRMFVEQQGVFYYITCMNENYVQPAMPTGVQAGILKGMYLLQVGGRGRVRATLLGSGAILGECLKAAAVLEKDYQVPVDVFSVTSFSELRREALECERWNLLHPGEAPREPYVQQCLKDREGPIVAATDYVRTVPDLIRQWAGPRYITLGTDGYGRSDSRAALRRHFEVDQNFIVLAALKGLADDAKIDGATLKGAIAKLGIDPASPDPWKI
jgi:pyruvate dehydrogenase E1 component